MRLQSAGVDVVVFMTAVQVIHLWKVAEQVNDIDELQPRVESNTCAFDWPKAHRRNCC